MNPASARALSRLPAIKSQTTSTAYRRTNVPATMSSHAHELVVRG